MLHYSIYTSVETLRTLTKNRCCFWTQKEKTMSNSIKTVASAVFKFMCDIGQASYAAHLARNQQWERAQALYKK